MSEKVSVEPVITPRGAGDPSDAGFRAARIGFPGPVVTGVCMVVGPILASFATALGAPTYAARGSEFVTDMLAHPTAFEWAIQMSLAGLLLMVFAVIGLAAMITASRPGWGRTAGVMTVVGLSGPIAFQHLYWGASHLTDTADHQAAAAQLLDQSQMIPRTILNISGPCIIIGFILLGIAAAKAGVLNRPRAILLGLTCLMPLGFISGYLMIATLAFACSAIALVPLGVKLLRTPQTAA